LVEEGGMAKEEEAVVAAVVPAVAVLVAVPERGGGRLCCTEFGRLINPPPFARCCRMMGEMKDMSKSVVVNTPCNGCDWLRLVAIGCSSVQWL
jgi:hypothetical protein